MKKNDFTFIKLSPMNSDLGNGAVLVYMDSEALSISDITGGATVVKYLVYFI